MCVKNIEGSVLTITCPGCGRDFMVDNGIPPGNETALERAILNVYGIVKCDVCLDRIEREKNERFARIRENQLAETLDARMDKTRFPVRFRNLSAPLKRPVAEWLWRNRDKSVFLSGETGTGKTSSAAFVVRTMLQSKDLCVRYFTRQTLFAEYVRAKTSDRDSEALFLDRIDAIDLIVIDEFVGKKGDGKLSDSAQELFFNLVDGVYSEARKAKVWILGNFFRGSVDSLVFDPEPYKRRINESFRKGIVRGDAVFEQTVI